MKQSAVLTLEQRAAALVAEMTLEEKISQMVFNARAIDRLDIPAYNWWNEALHGLGRAGMATVFPQAIGLAATWNPKLMYQLATAISDEARAKHHEALRLGIRTIYSGLTFWSPNINIFRDPRWGRGQETYGEDPYLTAQLGVAFVKGLQGDDPTYLKLVATPKHYAVHSGPEPERHRFDARIDERSMRDFYLFAFEACVKEGKAASVMGAYNRVNGEPACASPTLLQKILRDEWGFEGYVVSDCEAIRDIFEHHKVVETAAEAAALAVEHGCDLNCGGVFSALVEAVEQGLIGEAEIDRAVKQLFVARFRLGMFDTPDEAPYQDIPYSVVGSREHHALALQAARESMVLLKNDDNLLPLPKDIGSIAVIGPTADRLDVLLGNYNGTPQIASTPLDGIRSRVSETTRIYAVEGCDLAVGVPPLSIIPSTYLRPIVGGAVSGLTGIYFADKEFTGEPAFERVDHEIDYVWNDSSPIGGTWGEHFSIRWEGYLVPPVSGRYRLAVNGGTDYRLFLDGEELVASSFIHHPILSAVDIELEAGGNYRLRLDYSSEGLDPQIQMLWSVPNANGEAVALEVASKADVVVMVMGLSPRLEAEELPLLDIPVEGFERGDRTDIQLPRTQRDLLEKVHALGKPLVLVLLNGSSLAIPWAAEHVPAIVEAWYPGEAGGEAIADVLFGDYNPSGRLPVTFYRSLDDLPPFEDYALEGHTYRYFRGEPLYAFGHGLSFTTFSYDNLRIDPAKVEPGNLATVSVDVTNTGKRAGDEVVQLYTRHPERGADGPNLELKGMARVWLEPGACKTVTFSLHTHQLGWHDEDLQYTVQPGAVRVMVGGSSDNLPMQGQLTITGSKTAAGESKVFFSKAMVSED